MSCLQAVKQGAAALLLAQSHWEGFQHPDYGVPVLVVDDLWEASQEVATDLYDDPSATMLTIGIAGKHPAIACLDCCSCGKHLPECCLPCSTPSPALRCRTCLLSGSTQVHADASIFPMQHAGVTQCLAENLLSMCIAMSCELAGSRGKTTTAWFLRGILEEFGLLTGMAGSIEHSISNDRLTEQGALWVPKEDDPTLDMCGPC